MAKTRRNIRTRKGSNKGSVKYNMKGCSKKHKHYHGGSGCGSNGCPFGGLPYSAMKSIKGGSCSACGNYNSNAGTILGIAQTGGSCATCGCSKTGGGFYKPAAPLPAPFVGKSWGGEIAKWPGIDGVDSGRNYFANNLYKVDPQTMMKLGGSRKQKKCVSTKGRKRRSGIKGGGAFQDFINLGRDLSYNFQSTYNSLNGYGAPVNPKPYIQPLNSNKSII